MAEEIFAFSDENSLRNAVKAIRWVNSRHDERPKKRARRWDETETTSSGTTTGSCCCDELDCLRITGYTGEITPLYYSFTLSTFSCNCASDAEQDEVRLYQVDPEDDTVWRSESIRCEAPTDADVDAVTVEFAWAWNVATQSWDRTSTTPDDAACEPEEPDFTPEDPNAEGTTATTDVQCSTVDYRWKLTITEEPNEYGLYETSLSWGYEIGDVFTAIFTYTLTRSHRSFCRQCTNSFAIYSCGPSHCSVEPASNICLRPRLGGCVSATCSTPLNLVLSQFTLDESYFDANFAGGFGNPTYPGTYEELRDYWLQDYLFVPRASTDGRFACEWFANTPKWNAADDGDASTLCGFIPVHNRYYGEFVCRIRMLDANNFEMRMYFNLVWEKVATTTTECYTEGDVVTATAGVDTNESIASVSVSDGDHAPCTGDSVTVPSLAPAGGPVDILLVAADEEA